MVGQDRKREAGKRHFVTRMDYIKLSQWTSTSKEEITSRAFISAVLIKCCRCSLSALFP